MNPQLIHCNFALIHHGLKSYIEAEIALITSEAHIEETKKDLLLDREPTHSELVEHFMSSGLEPEFRIHNLRKFRKKA